MGIIAWALKYLGTNFHQIIMDTISTPLHRWVAWWLGLCDLCSTALVLRYSWRAGADRTGQRHYDAVALENIATYQQYGSVEAALAAGKTFHIWAKPMLDSFIFLGAVVRL